MSLGKANVYFGWLVGGYVASSRNNLAMNLRSSAPLPLCLPHAYPEADDLSLELNNKRQRYMCDFKKRKA